MLGRRVQIIEKIRRQTSKEHTEELMSMFFGANIVQDRLLTFRFTDPHLNNHPFVFFLLLLCFFEKYAVSPDALALHYVDFTGSFRRHIIQKRFSAFKKCIKWTPLFDLDSSNAFSASESNPWASTVVFVDSVQYRSKITRNSHDLVVFWASGDEELGNAHNLRVFPAPDSFQSYLLNT